MDYSFFMYVVRLEYESYVQSRVLGSVLTSCFHADMLMNVLLLQTYIHIQV